MLNVVKSYYVHTNVGLDYIDNGDERCIGVCD